MVQAGNADSHVQYANMRENRLLRSKKLFETRKSVSTLLQVAYARILSGHFILSL